MVEGYPGLDVITDNERSLRRLTRAIALFPGRFSLVLVCCNYTVLQERMLQQVRELCKDKYQIRELVLPHDAQTLYTTIQRQLGNEQPRALMVFGLQSVVALDDLLFAANLVRDEFRKRLPFPMILWMNEEVLHKLVRLAPDFANWAGTPIKFEMATSELLKQPGFGTTAQNERSLRSLGRAIALSKSQFSLVLVCCNYTVLQEQILQRLQKLYLGIYQIQKLVLPHNVKSLYTTIQFQLQLTQEQPSALIVLGLESVNALDDLLSATNQVREEFRRLQFPIVLWVNDEVLHQLVQLAPDFASWAATPIRFEMTTSELLKFLLQQSNSVFATVLNPSAAQEMVGIMCQNSTFGIQQDSYEFCCAIRDLQSHNISLNPELEASLAFVSGLNDFARDRIDSALTLFHQSLQFWQHRSGNKEEETKRQRIQNSFGSEIEIISSNASPKLRQGVLLYYMGLCYCRLARVNQPECRHWQKAKSYFQECLKVFELAGRPDIVAQYIGQLAEVLQNLEEWKELQTVAEKSLELHQTYGTRIQLACDYGFLAEVALQQSRWAIASRLVQVGLWKLSEAQHKSDRHQGLFPLLLKQIYRLILAKAMRHLGEKKIATEHVKIASSELEKALESSDHRYNAHRYIRHLGTLRKFYFESGRYLEAFCIKQKRRSVEQQYGFRAFIGPSRLQPQKQLVSPDIGTNVALEIAASGRERDINNLIGRISRRDQKLTVIYGQSGVGKSSTIIAGLVPALHNRAIGDQIAVPVVLQVYTDWVQELGKSLTEALACIQDPPPCATTLNSVAAILQQLQEHADRHLITVLIFDQFEEFFSVCTDRNQKQKFDIFISDCLKISFVKVILCLRSDYLHRLLEFKHLAALELINNNILDKNIRYQLKNFYPEDAKVLIQELTGSQLNLEPALIDALVEDLSAELGEVRPIELQVVGAQLQDEAITTLEQYQPFRPNKLIKKYVKELIKDCGAENERIALLVLYLLIDENKKRHFKTRIELAVAITELEDADNLDLVLEILVQSGLVVLFPDVPERYQLIHDYLVDLIHDLQQITN